MADQAPDYDAYQGAFHKAFRTELYSILDALPIFGNCRVIDVPCGNGFYARRLAERLGTGGQLTAVDNNDQYLRRARKAVAGTGAKVRKGDAYRLPFAEATFDLVWCAQSLISLEPARAVGELFRIAKPDGVVAILEADEFHRVLLPWPVKLEAAFPAAVQRYGDAAKKSPARKLRGVLQEAGFQSVRRTTYPFDRAAPFDEATTAFLARHFDYLRAVVYRHLSTALQKLYDRTTDADAADSLFRLPDVELVCINAVYLSQPAPASNASPVLGSRALESKSRPLREIDS